MKSREMSFEWGERGQGGGENPIGLSIYGSPIKTVKYILVNIWCITPNIHPNVFIC